MKKGKKDEESTDRYFSYTSNNIGINRRKDTNR